MHASRRRFLLGGAESPINIASLVVKSRPDKVPAVRAALCAMEGVEIAHDAGDGRLLVTVEEVPGGSVIDVLSRIHGLPGVVSACLAYHYAGDTTGTPNMTEKDYDHESA